MTDWLTWGVFFQIVAGSMAVIGQWRMGNKVISGPVFGLCGQLAWVLMALTNGTYALLIFSALMIGTHARNFVKWRGERKG